MDVGYFLENPKGRLLESHVRKRFPDEYPNILQYSGKKWAEKLYNYLYGCPEHNCAVCGKPTNFRSFIEGYSQTCSPRCGWHYGIEKAQETIRDKYGVDNISQLDSIKQKKKQTMIDNYGSLDEAYNQRNEKSRQTKFERYADENYNNRSRAARTTLNVPGKHLKDTRPETIVRGILDEIGIGYQTNVRDIINPLELDIYIPSKNIAIEINGVFWHSDKFKEKRYHINKFTECNKKDIQLLTIWEDQLYNKPKAVRGLLLSKLGIYNKRVGARQCYIKEVSASAASQFENEYHLQGSTPSKYKLGLYYKDELVSLMTFGKSRTGMSSKDKKDGEYELIRYCCKSGWQVIGGASKLFKHFIQLAHPTTILSFSSNDISNGSLYKNLGFTKIGETVGYWYIDKELNRYHRYTFNKYNIAKRGWAPAEGEWTERSVMDNLGFYRIWDSGQTKWLLQISLESPTN